MSAGAAGAGEPGGAEQRAAVVAETERVLRQNWHQGEREGMRYSYTEPSPGRYPWQWYWDSCFAAIAWRRFEPARARLELESLLEAQRPNGFIGHTIFWRSPATFPRLAFYNVATRTGFLQTETIQPPLLAWAWRIAVGDPAEEPRIGAHMDWLARERDLEGDGLLWIVQPDESGLDCSPKFEPVWRHRSNGRLGFPLLVRRNRTLGFDARRIRERGGPVLCETLVNTLWSLSLQAIGRPSATPAMIARLWDERRGLFVDEAQPGGIRPGPVTWASLAPLALPDLPAEIGRRLVEEHLLNPSEFLTAVAPPSVAVSEPGYEPEGGHGPIRRYWRGPTWINSAWMVWLGMRRLGYAEEAERLAAGVIDAVAREGLREYYDPRNGKGQGATDFAWSALVAELAEPDPARP
jgi:Mannosylglycerate hydrolase MGH1-like glycoside hydrolase domain